MNRAIHPAVSLVSPARRHYTQMSTHFDPQYQLAWCYMHAAPRPCFTPTLLDELNDWFHRLSQAPQGSELNAARYMALASAVPGVFNLGGDLALFQRLVRSQDRDALARYAKTCIDALYANNRHFDRGVTTIALVQGDALGGGFEAALSCDVVIAERSARMGFPEILFNLFPGMGAYSLLSRKLDAVSAERLIVSRRIYSAQELFDMSLVHVIVDDGQGERAVYDYVRREDRSRNGIQALRAAKNCCNPVSYEELMDIATIWVDAALRLQDRDLRMMDRLVARQSGRALDAA